MPIAYTDILTHISSQRHRRVIVSWDGHVPDLTRETWRMCLSNEDAELWSARKRGVTTHYAFEVEGLEHAKRLFINLCLYFEQIEAIPDFHANGVDTGRQMFFVVSATLGK